MLKGLFRDYWLCLEPLFQREAKTTQLPPRVVEVIMRQLYLSIHRWRPLPFGEEF